MQSADRALAILSTFAPDRPTLRVSELATELGIHKSTVSRLLAALERRRFVRRDGEGFAPGLEVVRIAQLVGPEQALAAAASGPLEELARETGEASVLGVRRGGEAFFVHQVQGVHILGVVDDWTGRTTPLHVSAIGKALIAFGSEPYEGELPRFTPRTITDPAVFAGELRRVRRRGYAIHRDELEDGLSAVAAPVFDAAGACIAAIAVTGPTFRFARSMHALGEHCRVSAAEITHRLGGVEAAADGNNQPVGASKERHADVRR
jgi:DNA-binding IclR family transcriptional regulator